LACLCIPALGQTQRTLFDEEQQSLQQGLQSLQQSLRILIDQNIENAADAGVFHKGLAWALKYDREFSPTDIFSERQQTALF
jgi:hypothetical protein